MKPSKCKSCGIVLIIGKSWEGEGCSECGEYLCSICAFDKKTNCQYCDEMLCGQCNCPEC